MGEVVYRGESKAVGGASSMARARPTRMMIGSIARKR